MGNQQGHSGNGPRLPGAQQSAAAGAGSAAEQSEELTLSEYLVDARQPPVTSAPPPVRPAAPRPAQRPVPAAQPTRAVPPVEGDPAVIGPGTRIGNYRVAQKIGEGAMASIYLARDVTRGRHVALKALNRKQSSGLAARRFKREFRALSRISHPNIVRVFEYGSFQDQPWFAMEYVPGRDLKALMPELRALPPAARFAEIEAIVVQVCRALEAIHSRGIVHRDLKPSNILMTEQRQIKLTDFGVAKPVDASQLTAENSLVGTLTYLAPEAFEKGEFTYRIDLYALGIMLYSMLTGRLPFTGRNVAELMQKHLSEEPTPPRQLDPAVPEHLEALCLKLMAKDPNYRHPSAAEVIREISYHSSQQVPRPPSVEEVGSYLAGVENLWLPPLVGRNELLHSLHEAMRSLQAGRGGLIILEGSPGTGKTRLAEAALVHAREQGLVIHRGRCLPDGRGWCEGLKGLVAACAPEVESSGDKKLVNLYEKCVAAVGGLEGPPPEKEGDGPVLDAPSESSAGDFFDMLRQRQTHQPPQGPSSLLENLFKTLSRQAPRVVFVDDLEGADTGTVSVLGTLVRNVAASSPLLVVAAMRLGTSMPPPGVRALLSGERTGILPRTFGVGPLSRWDLGEVLEEMFPDERRLPALTHLLHRLSGGKPLHFVELVRMLMQTGHISHRPVDEKGHYQLSLRQEDISAERLGFPVNLSALVQTRLKPHAAATRTLLKLLAAWEREVSLEQLLRVTGAQEELILSHLDKLLGEGVLVERWKGGKERYDFAHSLYRDAVVVQITPEEWTSLRTAVTREASAA